MLRIYYICNMSSFQDRIQQVMSHFNLTAKDLAEMCDVQRSAISHILNGRNRPNVSFLAKLSEGIPTLNTTWLLHGYGDIVTNVTTDNRNESSDRKSSFEYRHKQGGSIENRDSRTLTRVILLYSDGHFESYDPSEQTQE
ncbi:MAG: helix-turn-helix domain-containing protein [Cryomorphaceae bacterium]|nr:helix-turn-helix domain-containing protein [Cryomorphaceae bacterium]